jgi:hypothetical protein
MKKTVLTLGAAALLASPSLFAVENDVMEHLRMQDQMAKQERNGVRDGSGSGAKNQYKHQNQNQNQYKGSSSSMGAGSGGGQRGGGGGGRH